MSTLAEIESAVDSLPLPQQKELFRHLAERLNGHPGTKRRLPLVPATRRPITQEEIDDALDAEELISDRGHHRASVLDCGG